MGPPLYERPWERAGRRVHVVGKAIARFHAVVDPRAVVERWGSDALRYFLLRHVGPTEDADVDEARLASVHDAELADALGNLLSRTLALLRRETGGRVPPAPIHGLDVHGEALVARASLLDATVDEAVARLSPDDALRARAEEAPRVQAILHHAAVVLEAIGRALVPFLPKTAEAIAAALADPSRVAPVLFPKRGRTDTPAST